MTPGTTLSPAKQRFILEQLDIDHVSLPTGVEPDSLIDQLARNREQLTATLFKHDDGALGIDLAPVHVFEGFEGDGDLVDLLPGADEEDEAVVADDGILNDLHLLSHGLLLLLRDVMPSRTLSAIHPMAVTSRPTSGNPSTIWVTR